MVATVERGFAARADGLARSPADRVDLGLFHLPEELPGVGRERLDVAPLPLGVEGVERQR
jgi:hypothetical protein